jgi:hypothetical protein
MTGANTFCFVGAWYSLTKLKASCDENKLPTVSC